MIEFDCSGGYPMQIIMYDASSGQFVLNQELYDTLEEYNENIGFVTIAGCHRTGKSFLMNKLMGLDGGFEGFQVDPTVTTCTKGIWMWSKPVFSEKENMYIFFLDTEGSGSTTKNEDYYIKIFTLSILISSYFIYNSIGAIDEQSIQTLSLIAKMAKNIQVNNANLLSDNQFSLAYYIPQFLWVLRDFVLNIQDKKGNPISAQEYLEIALSQNTVSQSNQIRRSSVRIEPALPGIPTTISTLSRLPVHQI